MRRIIFLGTALVVLIAASVAVAATLNTYTAKLTFSPTKAGSKSQPVAVSFVEMLTAKNATSGLRAGALNDIKTTIYGLVSNAKKFPTCDGNKISAMKSDSFCPKKALIATGPVKSSSVTRPSPGPARRATRSCTCGTAATASCGSSSPLAARTSAAL